MKINLVANGRVIKELEFPDDGIVGLFLKGSYSEAMEKINQLQEDIDKTLEQPEEDQV